MKHGNLIALLLFTCIFQTASAVQPYTTSYAKYNFEITIGLAGGSGEMNVHVPVSSEFQTVTQTTDFQLTQDGIGQYFKAHGPAVFAAVVVVNASNLKIASNPRLPLPNLPDDVAEYLQPSAKIESNDSEIVTKAMEIVGNLTDELGVAASLVEWAYENIEYLLQNDSGTLKNSAKQVLQIKHGVCGDFSVLAAALLRSKGIPTKYISGQFYTGSKFESHAWLEIYVSGSGWVPIDPTNGKMMPDASTIKITEGLDPTGLADLVTYRGEKPAFSKETAVTLVSHAEWKDRFVASIEVNPNRLGENSNAEAKLRIENLRNYYLVPFIKFFLTEGLKATDLFRFAIIGPLETADVKINIMTPQNLSSGYSYTHLAHAIGPGISANVSFVVSKDYQTVLKNLLAIKNIEKEVYEKTLVIKVGVENNGNVDANVSVSLASDNDQETKTIFIAAGQTAPVTFEVDRAPEKYFYNFTVLLGSGEIALTQPIYIQIKEETIFESASRLFSESFATIFFIAIIAVVILLGALFLSPYIHEPKKPFAKGKGSKHIEKKLFGAEKLPANPGQERFEKHKKAAEFKKSWNYLEKFKE